MTAMRVPRPDGAVLAAQVAGQRGAPVLVLLQGQASSHDWWTGIRSRYEHRFHTVTMDYRGTGRTLTPEGSLPTGDTLAVLDALEAGQAHVYGTSMGGRVAQMLAAQHPDRGASLVLACSSPGGPHAAERNAEVRKALVAPDPAARQAALMRLLYTPEWGGDASRSICSATRPWRRRTGNVTSG